MKIELKESKTLRGQVDAEQSNLVKLQMELNAAQQRISELNAALSAKRAEKHDPINEAALQMIAGEKVNVFNMDASHTELEELRKRSVILREAIKIQSSNVDKAKFNFSRVAGNELRSVYREKVRGMVKGVIALAKAIEDERDFRDALQQQGIGFGSAFGNGMVFTKMGALRDRDSRAAYYLREVISGGWFTLEEIEAMKAGKV